MVSNSGLLGVKTDVSKSKPTLSDHDPGPTSPQPAALGRESANGDAFSLLMKNRGLTQPQRTILAILDIPLPWPEDIAHD